MRNITYYTRLTYGEEHNHWFEPLVFICALALGCLITLGAAAFVFKCIIAFILGRVLNYDEDRLHASSQKDCFRTSVGLMIFYIIFYWTTVPEPIIYLFIFFTTFALSNVDGVVTSFKKVLTRIFYYDVRNSEREYIRCECCATPVAEVQGIRCRKCKTVNSWENVNAGIEK